MPIVIEFTIKLPGQRGNFEFIKKVSVANEREKSYKLEHYREMFNAMGVEYKTRIIENVTE